MYAIRSYYESKSESNKSQTSNGNGPNSNSQNSTNDYSFAKKDNIYIFGQKSQLIIRNIKTVPLLHRSIELLSDPNKEGRSAGKINSYSLV